MVVWTLSLVGHVCLALEDTSGAGRWNSSCPCVWCRSLFGLIFESDENAAKKKRADAMLKKVATVVKQ